MRQKLLQIIWGFLYLVLDCVSVLIPRFPSSLLGFDIIPLKIMAGYYSDFPVWKTWNKTPQILLAAIFAQIIFTSNHRVTPSELPAVNDQLQSK